MDKPFSVGDWIHTEKYEGTIEDITFRSTRIRTADNSVVTIANWSKLEKRKIEISLRLPLETKAQELEILSKKFKIVLENNKDILEDSIQVDVNKIKEDNIEISIVLYTSITEYNKFLNIKQEININILKILEAEGIKLAYPGRNVYVQK